MKALKAIQGDKPIIPEFGIDEPYKEPKLNAPWFPDHPQLKEERSFGTLKGILKGLVKKV